MLSSTIPSEVLPTISNEVLNLDNTQQGSNAAYNLLNSRYIEAACVGAGVVLGGVAITYIGCNLVYKKYCEHVEEKFLKEIELINKFHNDTLTHISLYGKKTQVSLPPVFNLSKDKKSVDAIHFPDEVLKEKGHKIPRGTPMALSKYQRHIFNAINLLQGFYFSVQVHKSGSNKNADVREENGVVRGVISYLAEMLDSHCLKFEGYDYDIGILGGLSDFISKYMSKDNNAETRDFSRLSGVITEIKRARRHLEIHKEMLSLQEIVGELHDDCRDEVTGLIRLFAILTNKKKHRKIISHILLDVLADGKLQYDYIKDSNILWTSHQGQIQILDSPFKDCIIQLSKCALNVVDINELKEKDFPPVNITIPDVNKLIVLENKSKLDSGEKKTKKIMLDQLDGISDTFAICKNFVTKKLYIDKHGSKSFVQIKDKEDYKLMIERTKTLRNIATLIREIIILQHYSRKLNKGLELLGEIYITDTSKMNIFESIQKTFTQILETIEIIQTNFFAIDTSNMDHPDLDTEQVIRKSMDNYLETTKTSIETAKDKIDKYWKKNKGLSKELKEMARFELHNATELMNKTISESFSTSDSSTGNNDITAKSRKSRLVQSGTANVSTSYDQKNSSSEAASQTYSYVSESENSENEKQKKSFNMNIYSYARRKISHSSKTSSSPKTGSDELSDSTYGNVSDYDSGISEKDETTSNNINLINDKINPEKPSPEDKTKLCNLIMDAINSFDIEKKKIIIDYFSTTDKILEKYGVNESFKMLEYAKKCKNEIMMNTDTDSDSLDKINKLIDSAENWQATMAERKTLLAQMEKDPDFTNHLKWIITFSDNMIYVDDLRNKDNKTLLYLEVESSVTINPLMEYLLTKGASLVSRNGNVDFSVIQNNSGIQNCTYVIRTNDNNKWELKYFMQYNNQSSVNPHEMINIDEIPGLRSYLNSNNQIDVQICKKIIKPWHEQKHLRTPLFYIAETIGFSQTNRLCFILLEKAHREIISQHPQYTILNDFSVRFVEEIRRHLSAYLDIIKQRQWYNKLNPTRATELAQIYQAVIDGVKTSNYEEMLGRLCVIQKQAMSTWHSDLYTRLTLLTNEAIDWKNGKITLFSQACHYKDGSDNDIQSEKKNEIKTLNDKIEELTREKEYLKNENNELLDKLKIYQATDNKIKISVVKKALPDLPQKGHAHEQSSTVYEANKNLLPKGKNSVVHSGNSIFSKKSMKHEKFTDKSLRSKEKKSDNHEPLSGKQFHG